MDDRISDSLARPRFYMFLPVVFASMALVLAAVGIYGVISYSVSLRTHEIGVRMAIGAQPRDVMIMVLRQGMGLSACGLVLGLAGSLGAGRLLRSLLYGVSATDPVVYSGVTLLLALVALAACYQPARRAARALPLAALRHE
jgi:putative ABC transport system permease protein